MKSGMSRIVFISAVALGCALAWSDSEGPTREGTFSGCLHRASDGYVWLDLPLGEIAPFVMRIARPPYRLTPELAEKYSPLINKFQKPPALPRKGVFYHWNLIPPLENETDPIIVVYLKGKARQMPEEPSDNTGTDLSSWWRGHAQFTDEIYSATLTHFEYIPHGWRDAWQQLSDAMTQLVKDALNPPSDEKKEQLRLAIETASVALNTMVKSELRPEWEIMVREIDPEATFVTRYRGAKTQEWGVPLRRAVNRLGIDPEPPLPSEIEDHGSRWVVPVGPPQSATSEEFGLVVRLLNDEEMAAKMLLGGILIEEVLPKGRELGFAPGDIVLTCSHVQDLAIGTFYLNFYPDRDDPETAARAIERLINRQRLSRHAWRMSVLRGGEVVTFELTSE